MFLYAEDPATSRKCLVQLGILLCHKFPRVRKYTADKFYEALLTYSDRDIIPGTVIQCSGSMTVFPDPWIRINGITDPELFAYYIRTEGRAFISVFVHEKSLRSPKTVEK